MSVATTDRRRDRARIRRRLRIAVVTAFPPGRNSLSEYGWHLVTRLAGNADVASVVLLADDTAAGPPTPVDGVTIRICWRFNDLRNPLRVWRAVRACRPDAVLFNLQFATFGDRRVPGALGLLSPALVRASGVPTAVILHNIVERVDMRAAGFASSRVMARLMLWTGRVLTRALLRADYVALTIPRYVEQLRSDYDAVNVLLAPHGAFERPDEPSFTVPDGPRRLLAFGKWGTYKTVDTLIEAYRRLRARGYSDIEVVIAGTDSPNAPGYLAGVRAALGDLPGVRFTGYVAEEDVATLFSSAAMSVFPYTATTGSSGVLHQAGSYGRAAVLPAIGDFAEVIEEEGFVGQYFEPGDPDSLADAIAVLLDDPDRREQMGRRNYAAAVGIPMSEIVDWHLLHIDRLLTARRR